MRKESEIRNQTNVFINQSTLAKINNLVTTKLGILSNMGIQEFGYRQFLNDGSTIGYCSQSEWMEFIAKNNFLSEMKTHYRRELANIKTSRTHFCVRSGARPVNNPFLEALYHHDLWNTLVVYKYSKTKIEGFYFIASIERQEALNSYINHKSMFENITNVIQAPINEILSAEPNVRRYSNVSSSAIFTSKSNESISPYKNIITRKLNIRYQGRCVSLTKRQLEYLIYLALGYSNKQIAGQLGISARTSEKHFIDLRSKLDLYDKKQLVKFFNDCYLNTLLEHTNLK